MDERFRRAGFDTRLIRLQPWKIWALAAVGGALALAVTVAMAGLFLILLPILLVAGFVTRLLLRGSGPKPAPRRPGQTDVIDGHYEVIEVRRQTSRH